MQQLSGVPDLCGGFARGGFGDLQYQMGLGTAGSRRVLLHQLHRGVVLGPGFHREELGGLAERDQPQRRPGGLHGAGAHGDGEPECDPQGGGRDLHGDATAAGALSVLAGRRVAESSVLRWCRRDAGGDGRWPK